MDIVAADRRRAQIVVADPRWVLTDGVADRRRAQFEVAGRRRVRVVPVDVLRRVEAVHGIPRGVQLHSTRPRKNEKFI